jgi:hypothetical protein
MIFILKLAKIRSSKIIKIIPILHLLPFLYEKYQTFAKLYIKNKKICFIVQKYASQKFIAEKINEAKTITYFIFLRRFNGSMMHN